VLVPPVNVIAKPCEPLVLLIVATA
jgi:hypothetical protein